MAKDFPPNLDDGELWLPSEIFPDVGVSRHCPSSDHFGPAHIEDLAHSLAISGLMDRNPPFPGLLPFPEGFRPVTLFGSLYRQNGAGFVYDGFGGVDNGWCGPALAQAEGFGLGRARVLGGRQNHGEPNRFFPVRVSGWGRECRGTGVFLPRAIKNDVKKKPNMKGKVQERQVKQGMSFQPPSKIGLPQDWTY